MYLQKCVPLILVYDIVIIRIQHLEGALQDLNRAIELDGEYGAAYYSRATLLAKMGQAESAVEDIKTVNNITNLNLEIFANENNVWRSQFLKLEAMEVANTMER